MMLLTGEGDQAYFNNRLLSLLKQNKNHEVMSMFEAKNPCDLVDLSGKTLLHISVEYANVGVMQHLISLGANVNAQDKQGITPLMIAIKKGRVKSIMALLKANANIYVADQNGEQRLLSMILAYARKMPMYFVHLFFDRIKLENSSDVEMITKKLISARCPLYCAVLLKNTTIMKSLLNCGFAVGERCPFKGYTVLHVAVRITALESVKLLLDHGVDVNAMNSANETALMVYPAWNETDENLHILRILLSRGTHLTARSSQGKMQICTALKFGNRHIVREVLHCMADLTVKDAFGQTALHYLMENRNPEIIGELKGKKFDVNALDAFGRSALHVAAERVIAKNIQYLLKIGANVNISGGDDNITPLFSILNSTTSHNDRKTCIELLLRHGADIQFVTNRDRTIFDIILEHSASMDIMKSGLYHSFHAIKPILAYLALSESRGTTIVTAAILDKINFCEIMKSYFSFCRRKLRQLRRSIAPSLSVIFFKCLADSDEDLMRFARDRKLALKLVRAIDKFPRRTNYLIKLRRSLVGALKITKLRKDAVPNLCKIKHLRGNRVVVDKIISYMNEQDLQMLNQI